MRPLRLEPGPVDSEPSAPGAHGQHIPSSHSDSSWAWERGAGLGLARPLVPKVVGTDRGGGDSRAQRTLQAVRTSMEVFLWKLESKNQRLCSRSGSHGVNQVQRIRMNAMVFPIGVSSP